MRLLASRLWEGPTDQQALIDAEIESAALLEALLAAAPVELGFFDRELRFVRVNAALAALHGRGILDRAGAASRDVLASYFPVRRQGDEVLGVGTVVVDITQRSSIEQALRRSEAVKGAILSASLDCIITMACGWLLR